MIALSGLLNFSQQLGFLNISLDCTSTFFPIYQVGKLGFLKSPQFHILSDCEDSLLGTILEERERPNL